MTNKVELQPIYDGRKSFYKKAHTITEQGQIKLISYNTHVASIFLDSKELFVYGTHSATTLRHIKEFMQQNDFPLMTKSEIEHLCFNGIKKSHFKEDISKIQSDMCKHARENIKKEAPWIL